MSKTKPPRSLAYYAFPREVLPSPSICGAIVRKLAGGSSTGHNFIWRVKFWAPNS